MKYLLILLSFLFVVNVSFAQTEQEATNSTVVGHDWQFTTLGDFSGAWAGANPYTGTITPSGSNLTVITANTLSNIATGDIAICTNGGIYEITVTTPGASPVVSMQLINDPINLGIGLAPSGSRGYIGRPNAKGILPTNVIDGGAGGGLGDVFSNLIATYNSSQTSARIEKVGLETVTEAAHTKTAGQVVQYEAGVWSLASQITVASTGKVGNLGLIVSTTTNTFDVATADGVYDVGSALFTDNDTYYLAATAGNMITVLGSLPDEDIHFLGTGVGTNSILWSPHNVIKGVTKLTTTVSQTAHGFTAGALLRSDGADYALATLAGFIANGKGAIGFVASVTDANTFELASVANSYVDFGVAHSIAVDSFAHLGVGGMVQGLPNNDTTQIVFLSKTATGGFIFPDEVFLGTVSGGNNTSAIANANFTGARTVGTLKSINPTGMADAQCDTSSYNLPMAVVMEDKITVVDVAATGILSAADITGLSLTVGQTAYISTTGTITTDSTLRCKASFYNGDTLSTVGIGKVLPNGDLLFDLAENLSVAGTSSSNTLIAGFELTEAEKFTVGDSTNTWLQVVNQMKDSITLDNVSLQGSRAYFAQKVADVNAQTIIGIFGDSKSNTTNRGSKQFTFAMQNQYGVGGQGYYNFGTTTPPALTFIPGAGITTNTSETQAIGNHSVDLTAVGHAIAVNSIPANGLLGNFTDFDIYYQAKAGGGTFTISVDGSVVQTVNTSTGTGKTKVTVSGLTDATHNLDFTCTVAGTGVRLYEANFKRGTTGLIVHNIARGGYLALSMRDRLFQTENQMVLSDLGIHTAMMRFGANETLGTANVDTMKVSLIAIADRVRAVDANADIILLGVEGIVGSQPYNIAQRETAQDSSYGFIDLRELNPNWIQWQRLGYTEDNVHENEAGGDKLGEFLYKHFNGDYNEVSLSSTAGGVTGTINTLPYFNTASSISSSTIGLDANTLTFPTDNRKHADFLSGSMTINSGSGVPTISFWSEYDDVDSRYERTSATAFPVNIESTPSSPFSINVSTVGAIGSAIVDDEVFNITGSGLVNFGNYSGTTFDNATPAKILGVSATGAMGTVTSGDLQSFLNINTTNANRIPYMAGSSVTSASWTTNESHGMGTYASGESWFNHSTYSGLSRLEWHAKNDGTGATESTAGLRQFALNHTGSEFKMQYSPTAIAVGSAVTYSDAFVVQLGNGAIRIPAYSAGAINLGSGMSYFLGVHTNGLMIQRTLAEVKTDLGVSSKTTGTTIPTSTPSAMFDVYINTVSGIIYMASGTSSSADWKQISN